MASQGFSTQTCPLFSRECGCPVRWEAPKPARAHPWLSHPPSQGTHVFKAADRSSLVTVILQELPPVKTQDQSCRAERGRVEAEDPHSLARDLHPEDPGKAQKQGSFLSQQPLIALHHSPSHITIPASLMAIRIGRTNLHAPDTQT